MHNYLQKRQKSIKTSFYFNFWVDFLMGACSWVRIMTSFEGEGSKVIDKFNGFNFQLWKFKMEMVMAEKELWDIVEGSEQFPHSSTYPRVIQAYNRQEKKTFAIFALNLSDSQLSHIRSCKSPTKGGMLLCEL